MIKQEKQESELINIFQHFLVIQYEFITSLLFLKTQEQWFTAVKTVRNRDR